jgi:hypothetical protein
MAAKRAFVQQRRGGDDDDERASERACTAPKRARARGLERRQKKVHLTDNIAVLAWLRISWDSTNVFLTLSIDVSLHNFGCI